MRCPNCHAQIADNCRFCTECGAAQKPPRAQVQRTANAAAGAGLMLGQAARKARLEASFDPNEIISARAYNAVLIGVLLWGLLVNVFLCAYVGDVYRYISPGLFLVLYFICAFAGIMIAAKSRSPLVSFLGYNLVVLPFGLMISTLVEAYGGLSSDVVRAAFVYTFTITLGMMAVEMIVPSFFDKLGNALLGLLIGLVLCEVVLLLFRVRQNVTDWIAAGIFSLYIAYDIHRSQQFVKTLDNAVDCALDIYLDIANLFVRLLSIMGRKRD